MIKKNTPIQENVTSSKCFVEHWKFNTEMCTSSTDSGVSQLKTKFSSLVLEFQLENPFQKLPLSNLLFSIYELSSHRPMHDGQFWWQRCIRFVGDQNNAVNLKSFFSKSNELWVDEWMKTLTEANLKIFRFRHISSGPRDRTKLVIVVNTIVFNRKDLKFYWKSIVWSKERKNNEEFFVLILSSRLPKKIKRHNLKDKTFYWQERQFDF